MFIYYTLYSAGIYHKFMNKERQNLKQKFDLQAFLLSFILYLVS